MTAPTWGKVDDSSEQRRRALALALARGDSASGRPPSKWEDMGKGFDAIVAGIKEGRERADERKLSDVHGKVSGIEGGSGSTTSSPTTSSPTAASPTAASPTVKDTKLNNDFGPATGKFTPGSVGRYSEIPVKIASAPDEAVGVYDFNEHNPIDGALDEAEAVGVYDFNEHNPIDGALDEQERSAPSVPQKGTGDFPPERIANALDSTGAPPAKNGARLANLLDPNILSGGIPNVGKIDASNRADAFSPRLLGGPQAKPREMDRGRYPQYADTIQKIGEERGWKTFNPASVGQLLRGESNGQNLPPNEHRYAGYFQMRPEEFTKDGQFLPDAKRYNGPRMTPDDFANMSFDEQAKLYTNRLEKYGYDGTQNLGVMNAAPAYKNAPDSKIAYAAGSKEALANPAWVRASNAGGAVTVGGIKNWHNGGREAPATQMANVTPVNQANTDGLVGGGEDLTPYRVTSLGNNTPSQPMRAAPQNTAQAEPGNAPQEPPVRVAQNAGALNAPSLLSKTPMSMPQQQAPQQQAPQQQAPQSVQELPRVGSKLPQIEAAQREARHWQDFYMSTSNPAHRDHASAQYKAVQERLLTLQQPVVTHKDQAGITFTEVVYPDGRVVQYKTMNPEAERLLRDQKRGADQAKVEEFNAATKRDKIIPGSPAWASTYQQWFGKPPAQIYMTEGGELLPEADKGWTYAPGKAGFYEKRLVPIADGPEARKIAKEDKADDNRSRLALGDAYILHSTIDRAKDIARNNPNALGWGSVITKYDPDSPAGKLSRELETIVSRFGMSTLENMKNSSPTGSSGLGALSESELKMLQNGPGNVAQFQNAEAFLEHLERYQAVALKYLGYKDTATLRDSYFGKPSGDKDWSKTDSGNAPSTPSPINAIEQRYNERQKGRQ